MKYSYSLLALIVFGCISPGISVEVEGTDTSIDLDTGAVNNPVETGDPNDTEDTEDTQQQQSMTDIGLREMRQEYLWFNGEMALSMQTKENGSDINEFEMLLNPGKKWGVGVTLAPYNQESKDVLFGGQEVELFSGHGSVLTMQITENDQWASFVVRLYNVQMDGNDFKAICAVREFAPTVGSPKPLVSDLFDGFQILVMHRKGGATGLSNMSLTLNWTNTPIQESVVLFEGVIQSGEPSSDCETYSPYMSEGIVFGGQTPFVYDHTESGNIQQFEPLRARVDNLLLFNTDFFTGLQSNNLTTDQFHLNSLDAELDAKPNNNNEDGWGWWSFDLPPEQMGDVHFASDVSSETLQIGMTNFYLVNIPLYNELDSVGAEAYYYYDQSPVFSGE